MDELRRTLRADDAAGAEALLERYPSIYRSVALEQALNPPDTDLFDPAIQFTLNYFATVRGDKSVSAVLVPLGTKSQKNVFIARRLAHHGVIAYLQSRFLDSEQFYDDAEAALNGAGSVFDDLWIKLKRADTRLRSARADAVGRQLDIGSAARLVDEVISKSRDLKFSWLLGQALASKSVMSMTTSNLDEIQPLLKEAVEILTAVDAPQDAARPLYYLANTHSFAGDSETSLAMIYRCLHATPPEEHLRLGQLYWLAGVQAYRMGFDRYAMSLAKQAVDEAVLAGNYGLVASNISSLAMIGISRGEFAAADQYLIQTRAARDRVESPGERAIFAVY